MKHHTRTIQWRFVDIREQFPHLEEMGSIHIRSPKDLVKAYGNLFEGQVKELLVVFWLDATNTIMGLEVVSEGILTSNLAHPREVFRGAIVATAASIILAHNHPSGNSEPSKEDIAITTQLIQAGDIIGIPVLDHIILCGEGFTSLAERDYF
jgi:DNA repair protein RadC